MHQALLARPHPPLMISGGVPGLELHPSMQSLCCVRRDPHGENDLIGRIDVTLIGHPLLSTEPILEDHFVADDRHHALIFIQPPEMRELWFEEAVGPPCDVTCLPFR